MGATWHPSGLHLVTLRTLGVLGVILGALWDPLDAQLGDVVPFWECCVANLCMCGFFWVSGLRICFVVYLCKPLLAFVDEGGAGLDVG